MNETIVAAYVLLHVVFSPLTPGMDTRLVTHKAKIIGESSNLKQCQAKEQGMVMSENYDPATNTFGCVMIVHPTQEQNMRDKHHKEEGSHHDH
jgi:hypothetical protein